MKHKVVLKNEYFPVIQKPLLCVCACFQMVLLRNGYKPPLQEEIAHALGIIVNKETNKNLIKELKTSEKIDDWGFDTIKDVSKINDYLKNNGFKLNAVSYKLVDIDDLENFIRINIIKNNDVWIEFNKKPIYNEDGYHDNVINSIFKRGENTYVEMIDPGRDRKQVHIQPLDKIKEAIKTGGGFVIVSNEALN